VTSPTDPALAGRTVSEKFKRGLATRCEVLGDNYVRESLNKANEFNWPMQQLVTEYCWDEIWNRPGLDRKQRSILNLGMMCALNRPHELKLHVRGALNNGLTREQIREVLLQVAIYCGLPAAIDGFRVAQEVFDDLGASLEGSRKF
jgi:4-carboxymuconolactone decarboxylase